MTFETVDNILTISTDTVMTTAMAGILLLIGFWIKKKVKILDKYCIPAPVVGGFLFMFITWAGYSTNAFTFNFTNTFQDPFMLAFFTTVGLGASFSLLKKGGVLLVVVCQVIFMILVANFVVFRVLGKNYDAAVMCAGLCGHGLGATPSAIVNMTAVTEKYGMSRRAFMVVPIVGAFLVDIIYQPQTIAFIKFFVHGFTG